MSSPMEELQDIKFLEHLEMQYKAFYDKKAKEQQLMEKGVPYP